MRAALIIFLALAAMAAGAWYASRALVTAQVPKTEGATFRVTAEADGTLFENEVQVAKALEAKLQAVPGVKRVRTTVGTTQVISEVWAPADAKLELVGTTVKRLAPAGQLRHWVVKGKRPSASGTVCGVEDAVPTVKLDPLKLTALGVGALDVAKALRPGLAIDAMGRLPVGPEARLSDVAQVELERPAASCVAYAGDEAIWLVSTDAADVSGGIELESPMRVRVHLPGGRSPALVTAKPAVVTVDRDTAVTYWFSPALDAATLKKLLAELSKFPPSDYVEHVDSVPRVRLVLTGPDRELLYDIADVMVPTLKQVPAVVAVAPPDRGAPALDLRIDRARAAELQVPVVDIVRLLGIALRSETIEGTRLTVALGSEPEHFGVLAIGTFNLSALVNAERRLTPRELLREQGEPAVEIVAYGIGRKGVPMPALPAGVALEIYEEL